MAPLRSAYYTARRAAKSFKDAGSEYVNSLSGTAALAAGLQAAGVSGWLATHCGRASRYLSELAPVARYAAGASRIYRALNSKLEVTLN